jgi:CBS domain-containing protein
LETRRRNMRYTVSDVMTKKVVTVGRTTPFREIVETMERFGVSALPVLGDERLVGIVSEVDLLLKEEDPAASKESPLLEGRRRRRRRQKATGLVAADVMSTPVRTISPRALLADAAQLMDRLRIKRLVVLDEARGVVGIVSRRDLLKVFLRSDEEIAHELSAEVLDPAALPASSDVRAHVRDGVVTLEGEVALRSLEWLLVQLVRRVDGVVDVEDHLSSRVDDRLSAR